MPFDLEKPTYCSKCDPHKERDNVLSPYERLIICFNFNYCPICGRQLQTTCQMKMNKEDTPCVT